MDAVASGVGVLDGESFAELWWADLADRELPTSLPLPGLPAGDHWLVTARDRSAAKFSYASRTRLAHRDDAGPDAEAVVVDASVHGFTLELQWPDLESPAPPFAHVSLVRSEDPSWCYRAPTSGFEQRERPQQNRRLFVFEGLGAGTYRVVLELGSSAVVPEDVARMTITLPDADQLTLRCQ